MVKNHLILSILCLFASLSFGSNKKLQKGPDRPRVVVAWDIHGVLCSQPHWSGHNCSLNKDSLKLVKELHEKGIKQVVFSNISNSSMGKLHSKFPELFNHFDWEHSLANARGIFTRKPHGKYVEKFLAKVWPTNADSVIFFDDKPKNIRAARAHCMDAHVFCSPEQAKEILKQKRVL